MFGTHVPVAAQQADALPEMATEEAANEVSKAIKERDAVLKLTLGEALTSSPVITGLVCELFSGAITASDSTKATCWTMDSKGTTLKAQVSSLLSGC